MAIVAAVAIMLMLVGAVAIGRWVLRLPGRAADRFAEKAIAKKERTVDLGTLVTQIREMSRLETAAMRVMHVSTIQQSMGVIPQAFAGDEITFLAVGDVIAGIDLAQLQRDDVRLDPDGTLVLTLPPSQILVSRLDNGQSRVMDRKTGMFRRQDDHLESRIRTHAEASIRREATNRGVLRLASTNAEQKLGELIITLGFEKVRFEQRAARQRG